MTTYPAALTSFIVETTFRIQSTTENWGIRSLQTIHLSNSTLLYVQCLQTALPGIISSCFSIISLSIISEGIGFLLPDQVTAPGMMLAARTLRIDGLHLSVSFHIHAAFANTWEYDDDLSTEGNL